MHHETVLVVLAGSALIACAGVGGAPIDLRERPHDEELLRFIGRCEGAIASRDWDAVGSCFLPTAKIGYRESGDKWKRMELDEWLYVLRFLQEQPGYRRDREIREIEPAEQQYAIVTSDLREGFLVPGGRRVFHMREVMGIALYQGEFHISSIAYDVQSEETTDL